MCGYESMYKNFQPELFPLSDNTNDLEFVLRSRLYIKKILFKTGNWCSFTVRKFTDNKKIKKTVLYLKLELHWFDQLLKNEQM